MRWIWLAHGLAAALALLVLADAVMDKFGGDALRDLQESIASYRARLKDY